MNWCQNMTHPVPSFLSRCGSLSTLEYARNLGRTQRQRHRPSCKSFACWRASSGRKHRRTQPQSRCLGCHWRFWWKKHHRYDGQSEMKRAHIWADWPTPIWNFLVGHSASFLHGVPKSDAKNDSRNHPQQAVQVSLVSHILVKIGIILYFPHFCIL